jgi:uncharacterized protein involved in exopolysaccharide biosynthesis
MSEMELRDKTESGREGSLLGVLYGWRVLLLRVAAASLVVSITVSLLLPPWYASTATCLPPREGESRGLLLSIFSKVGMDFGASGLISQAPQADLMIGILKSRTVREQVVDRFDLVSVYRAKSREHAIRDLGHHLWVNNTPEGLIEVRVEDRDKQRAADMANSFLEFLDSYNRRASVEQARRTVGFVEQALAQNRGRLEEAAEKLRSFQEEHHAVELTEQTKATVEAMARLESERAGLEIQKGVLETYALPGQVDVRDLRARIGRIDDMIGQMGGSGSSVSREGEGGSVFLPVGRIPELALRLADLTREVLVQEKVYEFLTAQLEEARIQESRNLQVIQVLDEAVPPIQKARPRRSLVVLLTIFLSFLVSAALAMVADAYLRSAASGDEGDSRRGSKALFRIFTRLHEWAGPAMCPARRDPDTPRSDS